MSLLTGTAAAQLYYLVVYLQLVLLTPLLYWLLDRTWGRLIVYAATPCTLVIRTFAEVIGVSTSLFTPFFGTWLIFYAIGLEWNSRFAPLATRAKTFFLIPCTVALLFLQVASGFAWNEWGSYDMAVSQLKLTSMITSLAFCLLAGKYYGLFSPKESNKLVKIGNLSFGIYLCHMGFIMISNYFLVEKSICISLVQWVCVVIASALFVHATSVLLPASLSRILGFGQSTVRQRKW